MHWSKKQKKGNNNGIGFVGKAVYDYVNYFTNGEPIDNTNQAYLGVGLGLLGIASSMYIKESNPKLLDKAPFWKKAYDWCKEKVSSWTPAPQPIAVPIPVPVRRYYDS